MGGHQGRFAGSEVNEETLNLTPSSSGTFRGTRAAKTPLQKHLKRHPRQRLLQRSRWVVVVSTKEIAPREFHIKKKDVEAHGHTKDCPGCRTMLQGGTRQAHTLECRERFRHLMKDEEKVLPTREKRKEYEERMEEETRRLETKKQRKEEKKAEKRGKKREAEGDLMEEEEASGDAQANEARGEKRKAEGDEVELERSGGQAESSGNGMAIKAVMMNDEEAWDDVRSGWLDSEKVREARLEEVGTMCRGAQRRATG